MALMARQRITTLLMLMNHHDIHRGLRATMIANITGTPKGDTDRILMTMAAEKQARCTSGDEGLWYLDPFYAEKNERKYIPDEDQR